MAILVRKGSQKMWVKNPKKIDFWKKVASQYEGFTNEYKPVEILKEEILS